jgi:ankyrin repeat protein
MRMLLAAGADVDHQNSAGITALHRAALHGFNRAVRWLLNANARPEVRNKAGLSCATRPA